MNCEPIACPEDSVHVDCSVPVFQACQPPRMASAPGS